MRYNAANYFGAQEGTVRKSISNGARAVARAPLQVRRILPLSAGAQRIPISETAMRITGRYVLKRLGIFFLVVFVAISINFIIPRLAPGDPVRAVLSRMTRSGRQISGGSEMVAAYEKMFGLDAGLFKQYLRYVANSFQLKLGYSISNFPTKVIDLILRSIPWTLGLLSVATLISFLVGIFLGAVLAWEQGKHKTRLYSRFIPLFMIFGAVPYYLMGIGLLFIFAYTLQVLPARGAMSIGAQLAFNFRSIIDILYHALLPGLSIVLSGIGYWALGMRGMMISIIGEDYLYLAEAKGLRPARIFWRYAVRNAALPQVTALIMSFGLIVSGVVMVEIIFSYPGLGWLIFNAIGNSDYTLIQGTTFFLVLSVAVAVLVLDLLYPLFDPRITYTER